MHSQNEIKMPTKIGGRPPRYQLTEEDAAYFSTHTAEESAEKYNVTEVTIYQWCKKFNVRPVQTVRKRSLRKPDDATLLMLYTHHTATTLGNYFDASAATVRAWVAAARKRNAQKKKPVNYEAPLPKSEQDFEKAPNDETLIYLHNNYTPDEIAEMYQVPLIYVATWMRNLLERTMDNPKRWRVTEKKPSIQELSKLYETHTAPEIAEKYGVKVTTVRSWLKRAREQINEQNTAESRN